MTYELSNHVWGLDTMTEELVPYQTFNIFVPDVTLYWAILQ